MLTLVRSALLTALLLLVATPALAHYHPAHPPMFYYWRLSAQYGHAQMATWYGPGFYGHRTACGGVYTGRGLTAAHKTLPCGTRVVVTNLQNHRTVTVTITDRGPYRTGAVLDLSPAARDALGAKSTIPVSLRY